MSGAVFLGVDGGGTKTEFVCIDESGNVLARALTGTTYHQQIGVEEAVARLDHGIDAVCHDLRITPNALAYAFFGLPAYGEDRGADLRLHTACGGLLGHARYACGNDMVCGWAGSLGCEDGINIVAGTGSIGYGEHAGQCARSGGWGEVFGDEGSAYWIAIQGLQLFSRMSDGRSPRDVLYDKIHEALALREDLELCERIMGHEGFGRSEIAGLARVVSASAAAGDGGALDICGAAAGHLAELAIAIRHQLAFEEGAAVQLSWSGSVLVNEPLVRDGFLQQLDGQGFTFVEPRFEPSIGAALYARMLQGRLTKV